MTSQKKVKISDLFPPPLVVDLGHAKVEIQGLSIAQIALLLEEHAEILSGLLDTKTPPDVVGLLKTSPVLAMQLIALGLNLEAEEHEQVQGLPASVQVAILLGVWDATVPELKKLGARFSGLLSVAQKSLAQSPGPDAPATRPPIPDFQSPLPSEPTSSSDTVDTPSAT